MYKQKLLLTFPLISKIIGTMIKSNLLFLIFFTSNILAQNYGIGIKYNTTFSDKYTTYNSFLLEGNLLLDKHFELGVIAGLNYSHLNNSILTNYNTSPDSYYANVILSASVLGGSVKYYPFTFKSIYYPFIEIRGTKFYENRLLLPNGGGIWSGGFYNFDTNNDVALSLVGGVKISPTKINNLNIILEIVFQKRNFNLNYDEFGDYSNLIATHSEFKQIDSINFGIGLQFVF
jgi:hypothetical protein